MKKFSSVFAALAFSAIFIVGCNVSEYIPENPEEITEEQDIPSGNVCMVFANSLYKDGMFEEALENYILAALDEAENNETGEIYDKNK